MTKSVEAARAYVAAHDALSSPEHAEDVAKLRDVSKRVKEREAAFEQARAALFDAHEEDVACGRALPAANAEARAVILNGFGHNYADDPAEDFTPPAQAD